jgi:hypothetical protein
VAEMKKIIIIILFFSTSSIFGEEVMGITGNKGKAFYIAYTDFNKHNYPIERYIIKFTENENIYIIYFMPEILDFETADYGHKGFGNGITYWISKDSFDIIKKYYDR